jgi:hypothetical protein
MFSMAQILERNTALIQTRSSIIAGHKAAAKKWARTGPSIPPGTPPKKPAHWTLRLWADRLLELRAVETVSHEAVKKALRKTGLRCIPGARGAP